MQGSQTPSVYSVSDLAAALKKTIETNFEDIRVRGEISEAKRYESGHIYFSLKDSEAVLKAVCWKGVVSSLSFKPEDGIEVICTGRLTTYPARSYYQLNVTSLELAGQGALLKMLEERKKRLAAEGLFDATRKKPLPFLPEVIGLVTSPTGAVIRDILHRLQDRFPRHVLLWPVNVQGEGAAAQIAAAIEGFNAIPAEGSIPRPDILIVARGGGSIEDLMPFNEESVVRAAASSRIPLISAVGHETDTTLIDFASDWRAPTPTAAAERAVPVRADLLVAVSQHHHRLLAALHRFFKEKTLRIESLGRGLGDPKNMLLGKWQIFHERSERLILSFKNRLNQYNVRLGTLAQLLESFSFEKVLARGYALVTDQKGHLVTSVSSLKKGSEVRLRLQDGGASAVIKAPLPPVTQGNLFED